MGRRREEFCDLRTRVAKHLPRQREQSLLHETAEVVRAPTSPVRLQKDQQKPIRTHSLPAQSGRTVGENQALLSGPKQQVVIDSNATIVVEHQRRQQQQRP